GELWRLCREHQGSSSGDAFSRAPWSRLRPLSRSVPSRVFRVAPTRLLRHRWLRRGHSVLPPLRAGHAVAALLPSLRLARPSDRGAAASLGDAAARPAPVSGCREPPARHGVPGRPPSLASVAVSGSTLELSCTSGCRRREARSLPGGETPLRSGSTRSSTEPEALAAPHRGDSSAPRQPGLAHAWVAARDGAVDPTVEAAEGAEEGGDS